MAQIEHMVADGDAGAVSAHPATSKVIAVHLNYRSRANQRGRTPTEPSYFLKPPSSVSAGGELVQPQGTELLTYEGEVAIMIGRRARDISPEEAADFIGWYAAANDWGVHDFRWVDRGSNFLSKGQDGYTPIGPWMEAAGVEPSALRLRTYVNGGLRQDTADDELIFKPAELVADLSRFVTLEPGDVILAGTPAGTGVVGPGDIVEVVLDGAGSVTTTVVLAEQPLLAHGAMPKATPAARAYATGVNAPRPATLSDDAKQLLMRVSTATLTVQLAKHGVEGTFLAGLAPTRPDLRLVGFAHTLRYGAFRADAREAGRGREDAQKQAVETVSPEDVLIMEARGIERAGTIGDILAARVLARGGAGIVTDGGVRDTPGVSALAIPTYYRSAAAPSLWTAHVPLDIDVPITCAGVLVMAGDVIVGDAEGVIVLPAALAERVAHDAWEQEQREEWSLERVRAGESIRGVYPIAEERLAEYERWRANRSEED
ncbi:MAG TPA: fumarylacetoacetate hydrolase family protein [Solirubrobacteraceae bacterium]|jgi:2-keto-4-pentenoate hydratase/2-oxohepta-3-ene-1,7-dioic acid hydratase in catechol pathway/regulator of RNase E activity RraA|nr:fumarylacetoacetate hydrolase family protein [Solirubrobacteraceae bacterium]